MISPGVLTTVRAPTATTRPSFTGTMWSGQGSSILSGSSMRDVARCSSGRGTRCSRTCVVARCSHCSSTFSDRRPRASDARPGRRDAARWRCASGLSVSFAWTLPPASRDVRRVSRREPWRSSSSRLRARRPLMRADVGSEPPKISPPSLFVGNVAKPWAGP